MNGCKNCSSVTAIQYMPIPNSFYKRERDYEDKEEFADFPDVEVDDDDDDVVVVEHFLVIRNKL